MESNYLTDLLQTVMNRNFRQPVAKEQRSIEELCLTLLSDSGDVSAVKVAIAILQKYRLMTTIQKQAFFEFLAHELDLDVCAVAQLASGYTQAPTTENMAALIRAAEPRRQELLRRLNRVVGATAELVAMRCDLFEAMKTDPELARNDFDFAHLFSSWFNPGFLVLRRINWQTPANILEKIIAYEAVHAITSWDELKMRVLPEDRRCYAYFHPCMPDEPLIFVEVALCKGITTSIGAILQGEREIMSAAKLDTAVFYSISNCQQGLRGVSFGNSLIKQVVEDLSLSLPQLKTFVTLSPVPGFRRWIDKALEPLPDTESAALLDALQVHASEITVDEEDRLNERLRHMIAHYLVNEKRVDGLPVDSVSRFHLGNGASLHNLHIAADLSENGVKGSYGVMVNYLYKLNKLESNIEAFTTSRTVVASKGIKKMLKTLPSFNKITE